MEYIWILPIIIIILGFTYLGVTIFMHRKKTVPIGLPFVPIFKMAKKENNQIYSMAYFLYNIIMSFIFIFAGIYMLLEVL